MTSKEEWANLVVETGMEGGISILMEPNATMTRVVVAPSLDATMVDIGVDVRVEETEAANMEE